MEILIIVNIASLIILLLLNLLKYYIKTKSKNLKENNYINYLPGCNCGECGYNSCLEMIKAMEIDKTAYLKCKKNRQSSKRKTDKYDKRILKILFLYIEVC